MPSFDEESPDVIALHTHGKKWLHVFVTDEGLVSLQSVERTTYGTRRFGNYYPLTPRKAEDLIKAIRRAVKESKRKATE